MSSSAAAIDIERLLARISDNQPVGRDLRLDQHSHGLPLYHTIKDLRNKAREQERNPSFLNIYDGHGLWPEILAKCANALSQQTKDLELTVYLVEALLRCHGFAGLHEGFILLRKMIEQYWLDMYPTSHEDMYLYETKDALLMALGGHTEVSGLLERLIPLQSLTQSTSDVAPINYWQCQQMFNFLRTPDNQRASNPDNDDVAKERDMNRLHKIYSTVGYDLEEFKHAIAQLGPAFFDNLNTVIEQCVSECQKIKQVLSSYIDSENQQYGCLNSMDNMVAYLRNYMASVASLPNQTERIFNAVET